LTRIPLLRVLRIRKRRARGAESCGEHDRKDAIASYRCRRA
jgi:hypothetical protein